MKIKWIGGTRDVPSLGLLADGDERICKDSQGQDLIRQGLAKEVKVTKVKQSTDKGGTK